jgi:hypothetical protein
MASTRPRALMEVAYEAAAAEYLRNLPPEHFMRRPRKPRSASRNNGSKAEK